MEPTPTLEMVGWEITRRCNLRCVHCYTAAARKSAKVAELSTEACHALLETFAGLGTPLIGWTGGEPLLREDLEDLIAHGTRLGLSSGVTTNGVLLDLERAQRLKRAGLVAMQVSLDGSTAERNRRLRGASDEEFARVIEAIRISVSLGFRTSAAMVIGAENLDDVPAYVELVKALGVGKVRFCGFSRVGRGRRASIVKRLAFSPAHLRTLRELAARLIEREDVVALFDPMFGPLPPDYSFHRCSAGQGQLYLSSTGDVYPCTSLLDPRFIVGNIHERTIEEIMRDPKMTEMARFDRNTIHGPCASCAGFRDCLGACRGACYAVSRDLCASFPSCLRP